MTAIQPCALLLLVGPDWQVETVSANVGMLGDIRPAGVVGQPLADLIGSKAIHTLRNRLSWISNGESEVLDFGVQWGEVTLDIRAIGDDGRYLIEAELAVEPRLPDGIGMVRSMSDRLTGDNPLALASQAMSQLAALTGFDRLLLCDRTGKAIASKNGGEAPLLPAVDTPRMISDCEAEPVPLVGDEGNALLQKAAYQAPDAEQCSQLKAAGLAASMSLPIRIDGEQVAILQAYHSSPRRIGAERRSIAHLFAERLAARMARRGWKA